MRTYPPLHTFGLLGFPLGHSFSARYFAEKFAREGISAEYLNFECTSLADFRSRIEGEYPHLRGFNVTIPHKQAIMPLLDELAPEAAAIGAVNVVCVERRADGSTRWVGHNSDYIGFERSLQPLLQPCDTDALVLGTGGASKAVLYSLSRLGISAYPVSRNRREGVMAYEDLTPEIMQRCSVVVNCTPLGMSPRVDACPALPYELLGPQHLLYDLVYNPAETLFLRKGSERGARTKNGAEMLERQALAAWEMWCAGTPILNNQP